jgi:diaminohydroxyphosphoribosylaminopyrimidine deaminase / 5-amino-6-(5-phosphoribosylamino)uracil reductase
MELKVPRREPRVAVEPARLQATGLGSTGGGRIRERGHGRAASRIACSRGILLTKQDVRHIQRAIELAELGRGHTRPNPLVGAVVVRDDEVLGEGYHAAYGGDHAEVAALRACAEDPIGATMYVTLEPCCHHGRTPPCTDAIVAAGIKRVVVGSDDPTDKASGRGLGILRDEGVEVQVVDGDVSHAARLMNQPFRKHARTGRPHVVFKAAMSLDAKVATHAGDSKWISNERSREIVHGWRGEVDAICIGIGTALADDPLLTARAEGVTRQPTRVVFDSEARLPLESNLVRSAPEVPLVVVASRAADRSNTDGLRAAGAEVVIASGGTERERVIDGLDKVGGLGIQSMLLEGGPRLAGSFLDAQEIDEMRLFIAPIAIGGRSARILFEGEGSGSIAEAQRAISVDVAMVDGDVLVTSRLREW